MKKALLLIIFLITIYPALSQNIEEKDLKSKIFAEKNGQLLEITIPLTNTGEKTIEEINILLKIIDSQDNIIAEIQETNGWIDPNATITLKTEWNPENLQGEYWIIALIDYDSEKTEQAAKINLDQSPIKIEQITVENFNLGDIAELNIILENQEDTELKEFYTILELNDKEQNTIAELSSSNIDLKPHEKKEVSFYWDTKGIERGEYAASLKEKEKNTEKYLKMNVNYDSIEIENKITGQAVTNVQNTGSKLLTTLFLLMIISNIAWFLFYKKKIKHKA